mgnify:CR=1 FL=1
MVPMYDDLSTILDQADGALASALKVAPPGRLDSAAATVRRLRNRIDYPQDLAIAALVGGTGSGKSSLFNALLDTDEAEVGGVRPTTSSPMLSIPAARRSEVSRYLSRFGPARRVTHENPPNLVLIDMPDTDSVEMSHRLTVDSLLPMVDAIVWVVDIEKYRDDALHSGFLRDMASESGRFLFVVNQVDRVAPEQAATIVADFELALQEDGFEQTRVFATSAHPAIGPPTGIEELRTELEKTVDQSIVTKIAADLGSAVSEIIAAIGDSGIHFDDGWQSLRGEVASLAASGEIIAAGRQAASFLSTLAAQVSGKAREDCGVAAADVGRKVREIAKEAEATHPVDGAGERSGWFGAKGPSPGSVIDDRAEYIAGRLDEYVDEAVRPSLRARAEALSALAALAVSITSWRIERAR